MPTRTSQSRIEDRSEVNETPAVPILRFPRYRKDGEWQRTPLAQMTERIDERVGQLRLTPVSITAGRGFVSQTEKFGRDISGAQYEKYIHIRRGDWAYNKGNSNLYPQGCVYRLKEFDDAAASNAFICFRLLDDNAPGFFEGLFERNEHGRQLIRFLTSGARSDGLLNIKPEEFFSVRFPIPPRSAEQKQIADCLTSLNEAIAAQGRKVEALKAHKKGLMQHLFPQEGQTLPRLRFPEFRDGPKWRVENVEAFARITTGDKDTQDKVDDGAFPFFVRSQTVQKIDSFAMDCEAVLTSGDGVGVGDDYHYISGKFNFHQRVYCIYGFRADVCGRFFFSYFSEHFGARVRQMSAKNSVDSVRRAMIAEMPISLPTLPEQQRIADCLASLDAAIASAAAALAALKTHKKGLMQGLFPATEPTR